MASNWISDLQWDEQGRPYREYLSDGGHGSYTWKKGDRQYVSPTEAKTTTAYDPEMNARLNQWGAQNETDRGGFFSQFRHHEWQPREGTYNNGLDWGMILGTIGAGGVVGAGAAAALGAGAGGGAAASSAPGVIGPESGAIGAGLGGPVAPAGVAGASSLAPEVTAGLSTAAPSATATAPTVAAPATAGGSGMWGAIGQGVGQAIPYLASSLFNRGVTNADKEEKLANAELLRLRAQLAQIAASRQRALGPLFNGLADPTTGIASLLPRHMQPGLVQNPNRTAVGR